MKKKILTSIQTQAIYRLVVLLMALACFAVTGFRPAAAAEQTDAKPCIVFIDDVSHPDQLKPNGIEPFEPNGLAYVFDTLAAKNVPCTVLYVVVRPEAARAIPVITDVPAFIEAPPAPPENGLKLADLQNEWVQYRKARSAYDERLSAVEARREEARRQFIVKSLDSLAAAEAEVSALRRGWGGYHAGDVQGTILDAVSTARTLRASSLLLVLNSNLQDDPSQHRPRTTPLNDSELPPELVRGLVLVNTSYRPEASVLIAETNIPKHHASSLKAAADLTANLIGEIK